MTPLHVAVVGYGTAGQAAAVLLSRDGHRVEVFERAPDPGPVGAGFLLQPTGLQVLWRMGLLPSAMAYGARIGRLFGDTPRQRVVMDMRYDGLDARLHGLGMQRGALFNLLHAECGDIDTLHRGIAIEAIDDTTRRIRDASGAWHGPFDLVIAADGSASRLRAQVGGRLVDRPYPWGALWCLLALGDWPHVDELRQRYVGARKMIGLLPVGTRPGDDTPRVSFFWSLQVSDFDAWPARGLAAWRDEVQALWPDIAAHVASPGDGLQLARASYRDTVVQRWHRDRLVLIGDAAHAMSPQLGQGVNMALMDALALRDALRAHANVSEALAACVGERKRHVAMYQFWSRWLTPLFQSDRDTIARLRDLAFQPMGRLPGGRRHMLRVLSGTQLGALRALRLEPEFISALQQASVGKTPSINKPQDR